MSAGKKQVRSHFRQVVFERDDYKCKACKAKAVDAHHITDRTLMPNGGYVLENGISLCAECHWKAEEFHRTGNAYEGYHPEDLYRLTGSSFEKAIRASERL